MFNIKRFDPSQPAASTSTSAADGLSEMQRKIEERKRKRNATEAGLESNTESAPVKPDLSATFAAAAQAAAEWKPAEGESPAEREKRIKREKRAAKLGLGGAAGSSGPPPGYGAGSSTFVPPPPASSFPTSYSNVAAQDEPPHGADGGAGMGEIHPSRLAAPALAKEVKKKKPQEKTPARLRYLKAKKERAKGKKAGMPNAPKKEGKLSKKAKAKLAEIERRKAAGEPLSDSESSSEDSDDQERAEQKKLEILKKKEERKIKRDAKKAEIRRLKAEGGEVPVTKPRVLPTAAPAPTPKPVTVKPAPPTPVEMEVDTPAEPTAEQLEAIAEEEARLARKEAKRLKREQRRLAPQPPSPSTLIPTDNNEWPPSPTPEFDLEPITKEEPAPLLRLPGAMRPAAPSKKVLSELNVHESVRNKRVVDPERKVAISADELGLSESGRKRLGEMGITEAFAVQTAVLPLLLPPGQPTYLYSPFAPPQDICVSAPTGSGKTLSYVVPIVETLSPRVVTRLRALILLPTRDLVSQVRETFQSFGKGTGLKIGMATGQHSFAQEQLSLVGESVPDDIEGGSSLIDILIATPGRLMDHIHSTPGFSLQHLRYLVVDEADRLLTQSFHDWLPSILAALKPSQKPAVKEEKEVLAERNGEKAMADALAPEWWDRKIGRVASDLDVRSQPSCQKLLFSATLSRDPAKIDALHLHRPIYISVEDALDPHAEDEGVDGELKFTFPAQLKEHMIFSPSTHKPLYLFHLLHTLSLSSALCFTKSVEASTRLAKLVEFFEQARAAESPADGEKKAVVVKAYSSELPPGERTRILASFKKGEIQMLICSDLISRGIDLPHVSHVISYDVPADMRKYVHRVGRTARAGKSGDAWSLVEDQEAAPFKAIMTSAQHLQKIQRVRVKDTAVEPFMPAYQIALEKLRAHFATGQAKKDEQ